MPIVPGHRGRSKRRVSYLYSYIVLEYSAWLKCQILTNPDMADK